MDKEKIVINIWSKVPALVRNIKGAVTYAIASLMVFAPDASELFNITVKQFSFYCGLAIIAVGFIAQLFGVKDVEVKKPETTETNY